MSIFDRFANQFGSQFGQSSGASGVGTRKRPQTMAEWQTYVDGLSRYERDQLWPGMHKDLIPATEMIDSMNKPPVQQADLGTLQSWGVPGRARASAMSQQLDYGLDDLSTLASLVQGQPGVSSIGQIQSSNGATAPVAGDLSFGPLEPIIGYAAPYPRPKPEPPNEDDEGVSYPRPKPPRDERQERRREAQRKKERKQACEREMSTAFRFALRLDDRYFHVRKVNEDIKEIDDLLKDRRHAMRVKGDELKSFHIRMTRLLIRLGIQRDKTAIHFFESYENLTKGQIEELNRQISLLARERNNLERKLLGLRSEIEELTKEVRIYEDRVRRFGNDCWRTYQKRLAELKKRQNARRRRGGAIRI